MCCYHPTMSTTATAWPAPKAPMRLTGLLAIAACMSLWPSLAYGASVKAKLKKRSVVVINEGENSGVKVGDEVCFIDNNETMLGCGQVRRVQPERAFVPVKRPLLRQITRGMIATYDSPQSSSETASKSSQIVGISLAGYMNIFPVYRTNVPIHSESEAPYWEGNTTKKEQFPQFRFKRDPVGGIAGEFKIIPINTFIGGRFDLVNSEFEWEKLPYTPKSSVGGVSCCYTTLTFTESSWGTWLQYLHPFKIAGDIEIAIGLGLDLDRSKLTISYDFFNDSTSSLVRQRLIEDAQFILYSLGARLVPLRISLNLSQNLAIFIEGAAIYGLYGFYQLKEGETTQDPNTSDTTTNRDKIIDEYVSEYFKEALDHRPGFGGNAHMGLTFSF